MTNDTYDAQDFIAKIESAAQQAEKIQYSTLVVNLDQVNLSHIASVGGKNASTGEMIQHLAPLGINVPRGFATTVSAYQQFMAQQNLGQRIHQTLSALDITQVNLLNKTSKLIRQWIMNTPFLPNFEKDVLTAYTLLPNHSVAVRSSATAEDLPHASFAGQQESYLNVKGGKNVLHAIKLVYASLFTSRAISYRHHHQISHEKTAISVGIQCMVRCDKAISGVMFTLDTESGFDKVILISAAYGLGETIALGKVNPDEFYLSKFLLQENKFSILQRRLGNKNIKAVYATAKKTRNFIRTVPVPMRDQLRYCISDYDLETLARYALLIEKHYGCPMDIEWGKDGVTGELFILQARPETVNNQVKLKQEIKRYRLTKKGLLRTQGQSVGQQIGHGKARIILDPKKMLALKAGEVLVTDMTDPDWEPIMKNASAIITNRGGRTCHAAIIARELGIPAVVGCGDATKKIKANEPITVSCAEGQLGFVYAGELPYTIDTVAIDAMPPLPFDLCINLGNPEKAFACQFLPNAGVGLARIEFIISSMIGIHPSALLNMQTLPKPLQQQILKKTAAYASPTEFYIEKLREGMATIAAAFYPKPVIFRFSDFKSNEYSNLLGGTHYEPHEENPMIGFRGASRYKDERFRDCFGLECKALKRLRDDMGLINAHIMIPFVRTVTELQQVSSLMTTYGLSRGKNDLKLYMMCEIPANALLAKEFLQHVDGFSIGSNDLTQLTLGLDRDSNLVAALFDERDESIKVLLRAAIRECNEQGKYIGICGQGPSDHPDFAEWLAQEGIQCLSLNPDTLIDTWLMLAKKFSPTK